MLDNPVVGSGAAVGGAWILKEIFSFLLKWQKAKSAEARQYKPADAWEAYCREKFEGLTEAVEKLSEKMGDVATTQEVMGHRVKQLEYRNHTKPGGNNGRY